MQMNLLPNDLSRILFTFGHVLITLKDMGIPGRIIKLHFISHKFSHSNIVFQYHIRETFNGGGGELCKLFLYQHSGFMNRLSYNRFIIFCRFK